MIIKKLIIDKDSKSILPNGNVIKSILPNGKKAIILKEVITLVIAALCLIILFYLAFQLYGMLIKKSGLDQAKANLDQISRIINKLEDGGSGNFLVVSPKDWFLAVYNKNSASPVSCSNKVCLCFCPEMNAQSCNDEGVCNSFEFSQVSGYSFEISEFFELQFIRNKDTLNIDYKRSEDKR
ncbi:MAG: hypothetical protein PHF67_03225 [Candidatus Nanoarchaeia archaeon]|nr:hypothetical protein [Candidatus Nanoarchaeia archaeon]